MAFVVASIPHYVLGGAGIVMFGMVASTGIKILLSADLSKNRYNPYIIAISLGFGMVPLVSENLLQNMPDSLQPLLHSGILLSAVAAILLNLFFNGMHSPVGESHEIVNTPAQPASQSSSSTENQSLASQH